MRFTRMLAGAAAVALSAVPAGALAQMRPGGHWGEGGGMKMLLRAANLTPDQKSQVHDIMRTTHESVKPLRQQIHQLHEQIADKLAGTGPVALGDLTPIQQQIDGLRTQIEQLRLKTALQIRTLLTPDQLSRVTAVHQKMQAMHQEMHDMMGPEEGDGPEGMRPEGAAPAPVQ